MKETEEYQIYTDLAHRIIDQLVRETLAHVNDLEEQDNVQIESETNRFIQSENEGKTERYSTVQWPTIGEFTDEKIGLDKINEYIEKVMINPILR